MTAADRFAAVARPREELLAELDATAPVDPTPRPWMVVRQAADGSEEPVRAFRMEWAAERHARRLTATATELGTRYIVRRVES